MIFTSLQFVSFFALLLCLLALNKGYTYRRILLLIGSYVFYGAWDFRFLSLIFVGSLIDYYIGLAMAGTDDVRRRKLLLILSVVVNLGTLGIFKYANFFLENLQAVLGMSSLGTLNIILPVGISFFTFQKLSYTIDLYRGRLTVCRSLMNFLIFVAFFPQLVAGPIVRASEFLPQLEQPVRLRWDNMLQGTRVFLYGYVLKAVFADHFSSFVDPVYSAPDVYSAATLSLATMIYGGQIFCDFAGYSYMAIGLGRILGYELPQNFDWPYLSKSITEYWRRWHMSLSFWFRDYVYIPLGGNRKGSGRAMFNSLATMTLAGFWHGAGWNFVLWGMANGWGLVEHRLWKKLNRPLPPFLAWLVCQLFIIVLWVPFRSPSIADAIHFYHRVFTWADGIFWLHTQSLILLILLALIHMYIQFAPRISVLRARILQPSMALETVFLVFMIMCFQATEVHPFVYFQF